ncbi:MAG: hypothetical protein V7L11_17650 [Nostoc sp.]|uniref:hypothetical protein n=1 Tax=Nostoc sp. TaxID=1180 RepID=UPI002FF65BA8
MLFTNHPHQFINDSEEIFVRIGQKVKFYDSQGKVNYGTVIDADQVENTVKVAIGNFFIYIETVSADDLIEG